MNRRLIIATLVVGMGLLGSVTAYGAGAEPPQPPKPGPVGLSSASEGVQLIKKLATPSSVEEFESSNPIPLWLLALLPRPVRGAIDITSGGIDSLRKESSLLNFVYDNKGWLFSTFCAVKGISAASPRRVRNVRLMAHSGATASAVTLRGPGVLGLTRSAGWFATSALPLLWRLYKYLDKRFTKLDKAVAQVDANVTGAREDIAGVKDDVADVGRKVATVQEEARKEYAKAQQERENATKHRQALAQQIEDLSKTAYATEQQGKLHFDQLEELRRQLTESETRMKLAEDRATAAQSKAEQTAKENHEVILKRIDGMHLEINKNVVIPLLLIAGALGVRAQQPPTSAHLAALPGHHRAVSYSASSSSHQPAPGVHHHRSASMMPLPSSSSSSYSSWMSPAKR